MILNNYDYYQLCQELLTSGQPIESRIGMSFELISQRISFSAGLLLYRPQISRQLGWVESLQVVTGTFDPEMLSKAAPGLRYKYNPIQGYGLHLREQLPLLVSQLQQNPATRRAIIHIDLARVDSWGEVEKPCLSMIQFLIRNGKLFLIATIRSWDIITGLPTDIVVLGMLGQTIGAILGISTKDVVIICNVGSLHLYEADLKAGRLPPPAAPLEGRFDLEEGFSKIFRNWRDVTQWALFNLKTWPWSDKIPMGINFTRFNKKEG